MKKKGLNMTNRGEIQKITAEDYKEYIESLRDGTDDIVEQTKSNFVSTDNKNNIYNISHNSTLGTTASNATDKLPQRR
eukprot:10073313-Ditylum_brightwellii.AAC.1